MARVYTIHALGQQLERALSSTFARIYDELHRGNGTALYLFQDGWHRVEKYHRASDLPEACMDLYWRDVPENFDVWKQDQLVSVAFGAGNELQWFVRNPETTLRRLYENTRAWASTNGLVCEGDLFDKDTNSPLDLSQMLLDIYTVKFQIKNNKPSP